MLKITGLLVLMLHVALGAQAQLDNADRPSVEREKAFEAVRDMRDSGILVVRLKTEARAIQVLEAVLRRNDLKPKQRERHQSMLTGIVTRRDEMNQAMTRHFVDSFLFCPLYFTYDTSARTLFSGKTEGIIWQWRDTALARCNELPADRPNRFTAYYRESGGEYPYDAIIVRRVEEEIPAPFPFDAPVRSSFVSESRSPQIRRAVNALDGRLRKLYLRAMEKY